MQDFFGLVEFLEGLPPETHPCYETELAKITATVELLRRVASDRDLPEDVGLAAFCRLAALTRRSGDLTGFKDTLDRHERLYAHRPMFSHHKAIWLGTSVKEDELREGLSLTRGNLKTLPGCPGVLHLYAETVAKVGELYGEHLRKRDIGLAMEAINRAISTSPAYGKYYATRGRLWCILGEHENVYIDVLRAIRLEPEEPTGAYILRIVRYELVLLRASLKRELSHASGRVHQRPA